ncbi:DUF2878 domain-containing protein [Alteromonadaceae bacterium BrNp21-10]|nr:DUF2878 domain-containing protein [Alteromonadaceae bacterium BrNp21-10]
MSTFWIINALLFQIAWWISALFPAQATMPLLGILLLHFVLSTQRKSDLRLLLLAPIGWLVDGALIYFEVLQTSHHNVPIWLMLLWGVFILTLNHSLQWLHRVKLLWLALLGALFGSISYVGAIKLGTLNTTMPLNIVAILLGCIWFLLLPILVGLTQIISPNKTKMAATHA